MSSVLLSLAVLLGWSKWQANFLGVGGAAANMRFKLSELDWRDFEALVVSVMASVCGVTGSVTAHQLSFALGGSQSMR